MTELIITFRETLEASLIVGIILAYLSQTGRRQYFKIIFLATFLAAITSALLAVLFNQFLGGFSGNNEAIFEGVIMISAALLVMTMVFWMMSQSHGAAKIKQQVDHHLSVGQELGLFALVFMSVLREGVETVLFLSAKSVAGGENLWFALLGMILAIGIGFLIFKFGVKIRLQPFFLVTSLFLVLFGAGLFGHGVHELEEAGMVNPIVKEVWNLNGILDEKSGPGGLLKDLFGYNGNPSLTEVGAYIFYLNVMYIYYLYINRRKA